jgi:two-component system, LytTR family, response regulator LytT
MEPSISILIVEDEALIAENIKLLLEDFGYNIAEVCYKYETALKAIATNNYDLVITDINLGNGIDERSGIALMSLLKQQKKCPFIFLTAFGDKDTIKKASLLHPSAYLIKPVNPASLYASIQVAMENYNTATAAAEAIEEAVVPDFFYTKFANRTVKVFWKDVYHFEAIKNYVRIKTKEYSNGLLVRGSLQQVMQVMVPRSLQNDFVRINRAEALPKKIILKVGNGVIETMHGNFSCSSDLRLEDLV